MNPGNETTALTVGELIDRLEEEHRDTRLSIEIEKEHRAGAYRVEVGTVSTSIGLFLVFGPG